MSEKPIIVVAYDQENAIGAKGKLPWGRSLPTDLDNFQRITSGGSVIMGRKTLDGFNSWRLPNREMIAVTRQNLTVDGVMVVHSIAEALERASHTPYIIGGGEIYRQSVEEGFVDNIIATEVHATFPETDAFFPELNPDEWEEVERMPGRTKRDKFDFDFVTYTRKT